MDEVRQRVRARYADLVVDNEIAAVEHLFARLHDAVDRDHLLLARILDDERKWRLETYLRFRSHRPIIGPLLVAFKRRLLLPLNRWLFEYSRDNFERQQEMNTTLLAYIEILAIENARLYRDLSTLKERVAALSNPALPNQVDGE